MYDNIGLCKKTIVVNKETGKYESTDKTIRTITGAHNDNPLDDLM